MTKKGTLLSEGPFFYGINRLKKYYLLNKINV